MIIYFLYWSLLQLWENLITFKRLSAKKEDKDCEEREKKKSKGNKRHRTFYLPSVKRQRR